MPGMTINLNGDGILEDFPREKVIHLSNVITVTSLAGGMESGKPSVAFIFDLPDGRKVVAETSAVLFVAAARALQARYGNLEDGGPVSAPMVAQQEEEEIRRWIWGVETGWPTQAGSFLKTVVAAALRADYENYPLMRPLIIALKQKYPKYRFEGTLPQDKL